MTMSFNADGPAEPIDADIARAETLRQKKDHENRYKAFLATPLGRAFDAFERAHAAYWQADGYPDTPHKRLVNLAAHERAMLDDLLALMYSAVGMQRTEDGWRAYREIEP